MQDLFAASFRIEDPSPSEVFQRVIDEVVGWAARDPDYDGNSLEGSRGVLGLGQQRSLRWSSYGAGDARAVAFELLHPDSRHRGLEWLARVDVVYEEQVTVTMRLSREATEHMLAPARVELRRPSLLPSLMAAHECRCGSQVTSATPSLVKVGDVEDFVAGVLTDQDRILPVLLLATPDDRVRPLVDPDTCADELAGLAHVAWLHDGAAWDELRRRLGRRMAVPRGGARLYWPGFGVAESPTPSTWLRRTVVAGGSRATLDRRVFATLSRLSVVRVPRDAAMRRMIQGHLEGLREGSGEASELWDELEKAEAEREGLQHQVTRRDDEILALREEKARLEEDLRKQAKQFGVVAPATTEPAADEGDQIEIETWEDVLDAVELYFDDEAIILTANAIGMLREGVYPDPVRMFDHLRRLSDLADAYHAGGGDLGDGIEKVAHAEHGIEIALHDSELRKSGWADFEHDGVKHSREPHVKVDDYKSPDECGHIYFALDTDKSRFVVDHVGLHP